MRRVAAVFICILALAGCRLDTTVNVTMKPDGSGEVQVVAVADAELVARVTNKGANPIQSVLSFDDAVANGWVVTTPDAASVPAGVTVPDGGTVIVLTHPFAGRDELANVLNSIGPPLSGAVVGRTTEGDQTTNAIRGTLGITGGYEAFTDTELVQAAGGVPFATELANSKPADTMSFTYRVLMPGELVTAGNGSDVGDGVIEWSAPLDGTKKDLLVQTVQRPGGGGMWQWLSWLLLAALVAWVVFSIFIFTKVVRARRRRQQRRRQRPSSSTSF